MTQVYIVTSSAYESSAINAVFAERSHAEKYMRVLAESTDDYPDARIEEWPLLSAEPR